MLAPHWFASDVSLPQFFTIFSFIFLKQYTPTIFSYSYHFFWFKIKQTKWNIGCSNVILTEPYGEYQTSFFSPCQFIILLLLQNSNSNGTPKVFWLFLSSFLSRTASFFLIFFLLLLLSSSLYLTFCFCYFRRYEIGIQADKSMF